MSLNKRVRLFEDFVAKKVENVLLSVSLIFSLIIGIALWYTLVGFKLFENRLSSHIQITFLDSALACSLVLLIACSLTYAFAIIFMPSIVRSVVKRLTQSQKMKSKFLAED